MLIIGTKSFMNLIRFKEPSKYLFVGLFCQIIDFTLTLILFYFGISLFLSNSFGYIMGSILSYIGHSKFTFRKRSGNLFSRKQILFFCIACIIGSISGYFVIKILTLINIEIVFAKCFQLIVIAIVQYFFNRNYTFVKRT